MKLFTRKTLLVLFGTAFIVVPVTDVVADGPLSAQATSRSSSVDAAAAKTPIERPVRSVQSIGDVSLVHGGLLNGTVVDDQGRALAATTVTIRQGRRVLSTRTGSKGEFQFQGLRGGVYEVASARGREIYRVWAPGTAPKNARSQALIVSRPQVVRGQFGDLGLSTLTNLGDLGALGGMGTAGTLATVGVVTGITVGAVVIAEEASKDDEVRVMTR